MDHRPRKRLGQHFLHDRGVIRRIVASIAPQPGQHLVEIGPGGGALSEELLRAAGRLEAIELDRDLIQPLARRCAGLGTLSIHNADALSFDLAALRAQQRLRLVGNLPYNISTPLLFRFLEQATHITDMHLMLQRELVARIAAAPGSKVYGRISVMVQAYCQAESLFRIGPGAFTPAPKVESAFLRLVPHRPLPIPIVEPSYFSQLVARAFAQRRKILSNSLKGMVSAQLLLAQGISPSQRAEEVSVETFVHLANAACKTPTQP